MHTLIALFRGINVGGRNRLPMKELASLMQPLGCTDVRTVIQSGNVVFATGRTDSEALRAELVEAIRQAKGFAPAVMLLPEGDFQAVLQANPFPEAVEDPSRLQVGFLSEPPTAPDLQAMEAARSPTERFEVVGPAFYLHAPDGIGRSKLAARAEAWLGVPMTVRNWKTLGKVAALLS